MPHLIVEYSANLEERADIKALLATLREAALETGLFPVGGIRVRAIRCTHSLVADGHPDNCFVHLSGRIGPGRSLTDRKRAGAHIFAALTGALDDVFARHPLAISFELAELDADTRYNRNNLHDIVKNRLDAKSP